MRVPVEFKDCFTLVCERRPTNPVEQIFPAAEFARHDLPTGRQKLPGTRQSLPIMLTPVK
jgi:hypothetical protein